MIARHDGDEIKPRFGEANEVSGADASISLLMHHADAVVPSRRLVSNSARRIARTVINDDHLITIEVTSRRANNRLERRGNISLLVERRHNDGQRTPAVFARTLVTRSARHRAT